MVVGDGRKYLTCLITLKVVNMIMSVKNPLWTSVNVSLKIHHRWLRTQRLWLQQNSLTQEQLAGFRVLAVRSLLIKNIKDPLLKVHKFESFWIIQIMARLSSFVELCQGSSLAVKLDFFSSGNHLQGWTLYRGKYKLTLCMRPEENLKLTISA